MKPRADPGPRATIWRTVRTIGPERAHAFVAQALEAEANGGMLLPDGSRKRTLGSVFFYLVVGEVNSQGTLTHLATAICPSTVHRCAKKMKRGDLR